MAGAPVGNSNASTGRQGRHALELALKNYDPTSENPFENLEVIGVIRTLILLWEPILKKALVEGDLAAMKEINDRLDGKPAQTITSDVTIKEKDPIKRKSRIKELLSKTQT
jgi:hypothetical protein